MGVKNTTASGKTCQRWDATCPHNPNYRPHDLNGNFSKIYHGSQENPVEFFLNRAELSLNSVNSANSGNVTNH